MARSNSSTEQGGCIMQGSQFFEQGWPGGIRRGCSRESHGYGISC
jgi:hypothetical protein